MKKIKLGGKYGKGKYALVDNDDFEKFNQYSWYLSTTGYAIRGKWNKIKKQNDIIHLHKKILITPKNMEVDHINGNRIDNRKNNLRICTHKQNIANQKLQKRSKSGYKGVSYYKNYDKWEAYVCTDNKKYRIGYFSIKKEAALAYNKKAKELFGKYACLNIV